MIYFLDHALMSAAWLRLPSEMRNVLYRRYRALDAKPLLTDLECGEKATLENLFGRDNIRDYEPAVETGKAPCDIGIYGRMRRPSDGQLTTY